MTGQNAKSNGQGSEFSLSQYIVYIVWVGYYILCKNWFNFRSRVKSVEHFIEKESARVESHSYR